MAIPPATPGSRVAEAVKAAMVEKGATKLGLAEGTGIARVTLIRKLNAQSSFNVEELARIAAYLEVSVVDLISAMDGAA